MTKKTKSTDTKDKKKPTKKKAAKKKTKVGSLTTTIVPMPAVVTPVKRSRGRPRKKSKTENMVLLDTGIITISVPAEEFYKERSRELDPTLGPAIDIYTEMPFENLVIKQDPPIQVGDTQDPILDQVSDSLCESLSPQKEDEDEDQDSIIEEDIKALRKLLEDALNDPQFSNSSYETPSEDEDEKYFGSTALTMPLPWYKRWWNAICEFFN